MPQFIKVATTDELADQQAKLVEVEGQKIALFRVDGAFYALSDTCTHRRGPLSEGTVEGAEVTCPWHGAELLPQLVEKSPVRAPMTAHRGAQHALRRDGVFPDELPVAHRTALRCLPPWRLSRGGHVQPSRPSRDRSSWRAGPGDPGETRRNPCCPPTCSRNTATRDDHDANEKRPTEWTPARKTMGRPLSISMRCVSERWACARRRSTSRRISCAVNPRALRASLSRRSG
jgi:hypothetical protein